MTVASGTLSRSSSMASVLNQDTVTSIDQVDATMLDGQAHQDEEFSLRMEEYLTESLKMSTSQSHPEHGEEDEESGNGREGRNETLWELFRKT